MVHYIPLWIIIAVILIIIVFIYPSNLGTKKETLRVISDAYVYDSVDNGYTRYTPLGLGPPTRDILLSGNKDGESISYLKFNLKNIPKGNNLVNVDIDSAELNLLASSYLGNSTKFFTTVNTCDNNNWSDINITYDNRICPDSLKGEDSIVVNGSSLPQIIKWDVTNSVINATRKDQSQITYAITTFPILSDRDIADVISEIRQHDGKKLGTGSIIHFWPSEESKLSESAMPTLIVSTNTSAKPIANYFITTLTVALPTLGTILTLIPSKK